ncbi:MAG TPA: RidA family protein [bacterium]
MDINLKLKQLGISLPASSKPIASYINAKAHGGLLFISGKLPVESGAVKYRGKVGRDITPEEGYSAARLAALHALAAAGEVVGDFNLIKGVVKVTGYVNAAQGFTDIPKVINGASDILGQIFGERGKHARSAVGVAELPLNSSVEIEVIFEIKKRNK